MRPSYKKAIHWIVDNDDCEWLEDGAEAPLSISAALVADVFNRSDKEVRQDLRQQEAMAEFITADHIKQSLPDSVRKIRAHLKPETDHATDK
ncbi:MAG: hypothetical protein JKY98_05235 [Gammaproteobacteria bacterium]|nr:hypothetical protein [Gammaproteobacteria bacterium]